MSDTVRLIVFGLLGALLGSGGNDSAPLLGAAIGVLLALHLRDAARIKRLEAGASGLDAAPPVAERTRTRRASVGQPAVDASPTERSQRTADSAAPTAVTHGVASEDEPDPGEIVRPRPTSPPAPQHNRPPPREPDAVTLAIRRAWDFVSGGNPIARVALLVLFVGLGLLIRYAAEEGFFPVEARLALAGVAGGVLVGLGWTLRKRATAFALTLQGGGIAVLYLTTYAAYTLFGFLSSPVAIALMAVISIGCAVLALVQDEPVLAVIGIAGGFAAPILAGSDAGGHVLLFSYYALLNLGVLGIAWKRGWRSVALVGFGATFVTGSLWGGLAYRPELYASTQPFVVLSFAIYLALAVRFALRSAAADLRPERALVVDGTLVFGLPAATFALQAGLIDAIPYGRAISAVVLAGVYLVGAAVFYRGDAKLRLLADSFLAVGLVFATLAVPLAFQKVVVGALWVLEGAALVWTGSRQQRGWMRWAGIALQVAAAVVLLGEGIVDPDRAFTADTLTGWIVAISLALSSFVLSRRPRGAAVEGIARSGLLLFALFWWGASMLTHVLDLTPDRHAAPAALAAIGASALLFRGLGTFLRWPGLRASALAAIPAATLVWFAVLFDSANPFGAFGWLGWTVAFAGIAWAVSGAAPLRLNRTAFAGAAWLFVAVAAHALAWGADHAFSGDGWPPAAVGATIALALLALFRLPGLAKAAGRHLAAGGLAFAAVAWTFASWVFPGGAAPLVYIPALAPLDIISIGVIAMLVVSARARPEKERGLALGLTLFLAVANVTAMVGRAVHNVGGVSFSTESLMASSTYQAALAVVWTLLAVALTAVATRRSHRLLWFAGVGLLGLVVVKLFVIDLSQANALVRIGAFLIVGVLGLVVAYASPLPPRRSERNGTSPGDDPIARDPELVSVEGAPDPSAETPRTDEPDAPHAS